MYKPNPISMKAKGRPKIRWENDMVNVLQVMKVNNWIQNRLIWEENVVKKATMKLSFNVLEEGYRKETKT